MTNKTKSKVLLAVLSCAPMGGSKDQFQKYAEAGDVEAIWQYYQRAMAARPDVKRSVESSDEVSFEMLRPAMEAIYKLPTKPRP